MRDQATIGKAQPALDHGMVRVRDEVREHDSCPLGIAAVNLCNPNHLRSLKSTPLVSLPIKKCTTYNSCHWRGVARCLLDHCMHEVRELDSRPLGISAVDLHRPVLQPMDLQGLGFKAVRGMQGV